LQRSKITWSRNAELCNLASDLRNPTMPRQRQIKLRCPICKKPVKPVDADFPFCSERCRLIDLGKWASGGYVISSPVGDVEDIIADHSSDTEDQS